MDTKEMETRIKELEEKVRVLDDLESIKRLQRSYGYYLEHWMYEEVIDCFADAPGTELNIMVGIFLEKEGVRRYFTGEKDRYSNPELLHQIMQLSGVVDIAPDGKTAEGRWYGFGAAAIPRGEGVIQDLTGGIYTVTYIKEDGKWKIHKLMWNPCYTCPPTEGWVKPERVNAASVRSGGVYPRADKPRELDPHYPSGYIVPFHYKHPVSGKVTSEREHNKAMNVKGAE
jgi:hypothetical protein